MPDFRSAILAWFETNVNELNDRTRKVGRESGEKVSELTKHFIETRGTAKSGKRGRIETGAMLDSVDTQVTRDSPEVFEVRAGYNDAPFYTVFQELGTSRIEAMYALTDAAEEVFKELPGDLKRAASSV